MMNLTGAETAALQAINEDNEDALRVCLGKNLRPIIREIAETVLGCSGTGDTDWERYEEPQPLVMVADHQRWWNGGLGDGSDLSSWVPDILQSIEVMLEDEVPEALITLFINITEQMVALLWGKEHHMDFELELLDEALLALTNKYGVPPDQP